MSTLQVANIHLESTANNRIQYNGSNNFTIYAGGVGVLTGNTSGVSSSVTLINSISVSTLTDTANLTFSNLGSFLNHVIVFAGVNGNSAGSDVRFDLYASADGSTFSIVTTDVAERMRTTTYSDSVVYVSGTGLTFGNNAIVVVDGGYKSRYGGATSSSAIAAGGTILTGNTRIAALRLASDTAGRGFGSTGTIKLYGYNSIIA